MIVSEKQIRQIISEILIDEGLCIGDKCIGNPALPGDGTVLSHEDPIPNKAIGDYFRKWVNQEYPEKAEEWDLSNNGPHDKEPAITAWKELGAEWIESISRGEVETDERQRTSAIVWNNKDAKPVSNALFDPIERTARNTWWIPDIIGDAVGSLSDNIPQGHAGIILINKTGEAFCIDFGAGGPWGCSPKSIRRDFGIFVLGGTRIKRMGSVNRDPDGNIHPKAIQQLVRDVAQVIGVAPDEWGLIKNMSFRKSYQFIASPKCRPYSIIPNMYDTNWLIDINKLDGDNCGSFTAKAALAGIKETISQDLMGKLILTPDQVIPMLKMAGVFDKTGTS